MLIIRSFKYRIYPTKKQIVQLNSILENSRLFFNQILETEKNLLNDGQPVLLNYDLLKWCDKNKNNFSCWKQIPSFARMYVATRVSESLDRCFKKQNKFPRFKSKNSYKSIVFPYSSLKKDFYDYENKRIQIPKIGKIKTVFHRNLPEDCKILTVTLKQNNINQWFITIVCQYEIKQQIHNGKDIGIDVGITDLIVTSTNDRVENPRFYKKSQDRLKVLSRRLSSKKKGSSNRSKVRLKVAKLHNKTSNQRHDFLHRLSFKLVKENKFIALEDLNFKRMTEGRGYKNPFSKGILDSGWGFLKHCLEYKGEVTGTTIEYVDPKNTTQTCSNCGNIPFEKLQIWNRNYECSVCEMVKDRDHNAAINILNKTGRNYPEVSLDLRTS